MIFPGETAETERAAAVSTANRPLLPTRTVPTIPRMDFGDDSETQPPPGMEKLDSRPFPHAHIHSHRNGQFVDPATDIVPWQHQVAVPRGRARGGRVRGRVTRRGSNGRGNGGSQSLISTVVPDSEPELVMDEEEPGSSAVRGRGAKFTAKEGLWLAKAWVEQSKKGPNQARMSMWKSITDICSRKFGMMRTSEMLRGAWSKMAQQTQHFIAANARVQRLRPSGASDDDMEHAAMQLYRRVAGRKGRNNDIVYAPRFIFTEAAEFLRQEPKFISCYPIAGLESVRSSRRVSRTDQAEHDDMPEREDTDAGGGGQCDRNGEGAIVVEEGEGVGRSDAGCRQNERPVGAKRQKALDRCAEKRQKKDDTLKQIRDEIKRANDIFEANAKVEREVMLLSVLGKDSLEYRNLLERVMSTHDVVSRVTTVQGGVGERNVSEDMVCEVTGVSTEGHTKDVSGESVGLTNGSGELTRDRDIGQDDVEGCCEGDAEDGLSDGAVLGIINMSRRIMG